MTFRLHQSKFQFRFIHHAFWKNQDLISQLAKICLFHTRKCLFLLFFSFSAFRTFQELYLFRVFNDSTFFQYIIWFRKDFYFCKSLQANLKNFNPIISFSFSKSYYRFRWYKIKYNLVFCFFHSSSYTFWMFDLDLNIEKSLLCNRGTLDIFLGFFFSQRKEHLKLDFQFAILTFHLFAVVWKILWIEYIEAALNLKEALLI
jgi:hypothetical protein